MFKNFNPNDPESYMKMNAGAALGASQNTRMVFGKFNMDQVPDRDTELRSSQLKEVSY